MKKNIIVFLLLLLFSFLEAKEIDCINNPNAEVVDYGFGDISARMYSSGGVITRFIFAPFNRINFGGSLDIDKLIGKEHPEVREPSFYFKWRIYDGSPKFPAVALGYDGQGFNYNSQNEEYISPAKGLFLVFSMNFIKDTFFLDFGGNVTKYNNKTTLLGFTSLRVLWENVIYLGVEAENLGKEEIQQVNCKLGVILVKVVFLDLIFNNVYSKNSDIERQLRISYAYKFM